MVRLGQRKVGKLRGVKAPMTLADQLQLLAEAADAAEGRSDTAEARGVLGRAAERLALSGEHTVVALAGSTGSGKSSLFNALTGTTLAQVGVLRPTTSHALAATFGSDATALLDWLGVMRRERVEGDAGLANLVLLDLPDHDSIERDHRAEVDRLATVVDQFVWVVDPQKYADAALHRDYLRPMAGHRDVTRVVLNQCDLLSEADLERCLEHLRRILDDHGLAGVPIAATSTVTGFGISALRRELSSVAQGKAAAAQRLSADVRHAAVTLGAGLGSASGGLTSGATDRLVAALADAAGVETVAVAVEDATRYRGASATGWPFVAWLKKLRPDPLKRLRVVPRRAAIGDEIERTSLPRPSAAQNARTASAIRALANEAVTGLPGGWRDAVAAAARSNAERLPDRLDQAVATTDLQAGRGVGWWRTMRIVQWVLMTCVLVGLGWLGVNFALAYFMLPPLPGGWIGPEGGFRVPVPTALVIGGVALGLAFAAASNALIGLAARAASSRARLALMRAIRDVTVADVVEPVRAELERHDRAIELVDRLR